MEKEFKSVCTPDGWTLPCRSLREKDNAEMVIMTQFDERCRVQVSKAEEVMKLVDSILNPKRPAGQSPTVSFVVNPQGFWWHDEKNVPKLIHQDPKLQIDI